MKKNSKTTGLLLSILLIILSACETQTGNEKEDVDFGSLKTSYKKGEIVVSYQNEKNAPFLKDSVRSFILKKFPDAKQLECSKCLNLVELWRAEGIEYFMNDLLEQFSEGHGEIKKTTPIATAGATGDEWLAVSLNYEFEVESAKSDSLDSVFNSDLYPIRENLVLAVLDSGLDFEYFPNEFLKETDPLSGCYSETAFGWNFTVDGGNDNINDETSSKHGTLVNLYILEEVVNNSGYIPRFLNIKVLDEDNKGTLFSLLCGFHFARQQRAHIVNASLGFYVDGDFSEFKYGKHPMMTYLTRDFLEGHQMLVVAAAGNENGDPHNNRNLEENAFYPAVLSHLGEKDSTNFVAVTTSDNAGTSISSSQNYSSIYVDAAIRSDIENGFGFYLPFGRNNQEESVSGSSFAAAILTGQIVNRWDSLSEIDFRKNSKSEWKQQVIPIGNFTSRELERLSNKVNRGISYPRLNNRQ